MNRPRNRQPRQNQNQQHQSRGQNYNRPPRSSKPAPGSVPDITQVLPGAAVSIVLKADQPTGREVQGVIADILTRGNHPRGIKVRLRDGRVGRVQRMADAGQMSSGTEERWPASVPTSPGSGAERTGWAGNRAADLGNGDVPPARSLADFIPQPPSEPSARSTGPEHATFASATATCPICGAFEGDEAAVSHHVQSHLD